MPFRNRAFVSRSFLVSLLIASAASAQAPANDDFIGAIQIVPGLNPAGSEVYLNFAATNSVQPTPSCASGIEGDMWFYVDPTWTGPTVVGTCGAPLYGFGGGMQDSVLAVYASLGPVLGPQIACSDDGCGLRSEVSFLAFVGVRVYIRVASYELSTRGAFKVTVAPPPPSNDEPTGALPLATGMNPAGGGAFQNAGATATPDYATCNTVSLTYGFPGIPGGGTIYSPVPGYHDVFFSYTPPASMTTSVTAATPSGVASGFQDAVVEIYDGPTRVGCSGESSGTGPASADFLASVGKTYLVRVSTLTTYAWGPFTLEVKPRLALTLSAPFGPGSLRAWVNGGTPGAAYFSFYTLTQGAYPNGWFYGISPSMTEIFLQLAVSGAPFSGVLDVTGSARFDVPAGLPPITLYGVTTTFGAGGAFDVSEPSSFTIP